MFVFFCFPAEFKFRTWHFCGEKSIFKTYKNLGLSISVQNFPKENSFYKEFPKNSKSFLVFVGSEGCTD